MKRFLVAASLALILHGLFFCLSPKRPDRISPAPPPHLTVTFAVRENIERGPGPELNSPPPFQKEGMTGREPIEERAVVPQAPPEESPAPHETIASPGEAPARPRAEVRTNETPRKAEMKSPPKRRIPEKNKRISPPSPDGRLLQTEKTEAPDPISEAIAAPDKKTHDFPTETTPGGAAGPRMNVPAPAGAIPPGPGGKADVVPSGGEMRKATPAYRKNPRPEYPRAARRRGYEGTVLLDVLVNRYGKVDDLKVLESSGYGILDRSAVASVKTWLFEPGSVGARKVDMWVRVPVRFELKDP